MRRWRRLACGGCLLMVGQVLRAQATAAVRDSTKGNVFGVVTDRDKRPIACASVGIIGGTTSALTDALGRFAIVGIPVGTQLVRARAVGYQQRFLRVEVSGAETVDGSLVLERSASPLDTVRVVARSPYDKPARLDYTTKYDDFYLRRRTGMGTYLTREAIDSMPGATSKARDVANRIPLLQPPGNGAHKCTSVGLMLDGLPADITVLDELNSTELESMEYHRGISDSPVGTRPCTLYVYTR